MSKPRVTERDQEIAFNFRGSIVDLPELLAAYREEVTGELVKALKAACDALQDEQDASGDSDHPIIREHARVIGRGRKLLEKNS